VSFAVETVEEEDDSLADSMPINAVDFVQNCGNNTSIPLDIGSGGVFPFNDDPNFDRDNPNLDPDIAIDECYVQQLVPTDPLAAETYFQQGIRAQLDTGAKVSCTNQQHLLHDYKPYNSSRPCPIWLTAARKCSHTSRIRIPTSPSTQSSWLHQGILLLFAKAFLYSHK